MRSVGLTVPNENRAPQGAPEISPGRSPGKQCKPNAHAEGVPETFTRSPQIFFVVLDTGQSQQFYIFLLHRSLSMVLFLIEHIFSNPFKLRCADRKSSISVLPTEFLIINFCMDPFRRRHLYI